MLPISLKQLETFVAVAETGGFRPASERLNLSQSSVTAHVKQLEESLGVPLFHRTTRSVRLTTAGSSLLERANRALNGIADAVNAFRDEAAMTAGRILIACAPTFASSMLPRTLAAFQSRHPGIFVQVREAYGSEIIEAIRADGVDFGIGPLERDDKDLEFHQLFTDTFVAVVGLSHPLAGRTSIRFREILEEPLLTMPRRSATRLRIEAIFAENGRVLAPKYEMLHHQTLISMAEAGLGIAVLPQTAMTVAEHANYRVIPLTHPQVIRRMGVITLRGNVLTPAARAFVDLLPTMTATAAGRNNK